MSTRCHSPRDPSAPARQVADDLFRRTKSALIRGSGQDHENELVLSRLDSGEEEQEEASDKTCIRFGLGAEPPGFQALSSRMEITFLGGNVYELYCSVDGGRSRRWTYAVRNERSASAPPTSGPARSPSRSHLEEIVDFLTEELKRKLGHLLLQSPTSASAR